MGWGGPGGYWYRIGVIGVLDGLGGKFVVEVNSKMPSLTGFYLSINSIN